MNLYIVNENNTNGFQSVLFQIITLSALLCAILVIVSKNPIVSVLFLIGLFLSISIYLMMLGLNFIGLSYLLVYVGAVSILFLFILMLINIRISEIISSTSNSIPLAFFIGTFFFYAIYQVLPLPSTKGIPFPFFVERVKEQGLCQDLPIEYASDSLEYSMEFTLLPPSLREEIKKYCYSIYDFLFAVKPGSYSIDSTATSYLGKDQSLEFVSSQVWDAMLAESSHITILGNIMYTTFPLWILLTSLILLLAMVGAIVITLKN